MSRIKFNKENILGYRDGAASGMASRLMPLGFMPEEAQCLGQAAYLPAEQIAANYPKPLRPRPEISHLINLAIKGLSQNPYGPKAHLGRIVLWECIFGEGSWHEEIEYTADDRGYMAVFQDALLGELAPLPAAAVPQAVRHSSDELSATPEPVHQQVPAQVGARTEAPTTPAPARTVAPQPSLLAEKLPPPDVVSDGRGAFITAGVLSILFGGVNLVALIEAMLGLDAESGAEFVGFGTFLLFIGTFGMLCIGGAAASGVNTLVGKVMLLIASLSMMAAHILLSMTGWTPGGFGIVLAIIPGVIAAFVIRSIARGRANLAA